MSGRTLTSVFDEFELLDSLGEELVGLDDEWQFTHVNDQIVERTGIAADSLLGKTIWESLPDLVGTRFESELRDAMTTGESRSFEYRPDGTRGWYRVRALPGEEGLLVHFRDVAEEKRSERERDEQLRQQRAVAEFGQNALARSDLDLLFREATELIAELIDHEYCKVLDLHRDGKALTLRAGVGWQAGLVGSATVPTHLDSQAGYTLLSSKPVVVNDLRTETRFSGPELLHNHGVRGGISVIIGTVEEPWGILGTHTTVSREYEDHDVQFVQSIANILATAIERHERESELDSRRRSLESLNETNTIIRSVDRALVQAVTRQQMYEAVCDALAKTELYDVGVVVERGSSNTNIEIQAQAGGKPEAVQEFVELNNAATSGSPMKDAFETGELVVIKDMGDESELNDELRRFAMRHSVSMHISIPLVHDEMVYAVLSLRSLERTMTADEISILEELGETIGNAINTLQTRELLFSQTALELEFDLSETDAFLVPLSAEYECTFTIERVVSGADGLLMYCTATGVHPADIKEELLALPPVHRVRVIEDAKDEGRFEMTFQETSVLRALIERGAIISEATASDGEGRVRIEVAPDADVRAFAEEISAVYPESRLVGKREIKREQRALSKHRTAIEEALTERQKAAVEVAYFAGYYDWPRKNTAEEVADSLGVSTATFHQHHRKAIKKVFTELLGV
ncbi:bacterio-opsin activator domain-containing protein [Haladaptatus caseinilyticus]|uniref:bacterio-opsin activator domain-containing protein n=1 Tax=Haladaptatus caseinilyticus TaxID=2993314 RepID=UPI00224B632E|nr:bacterio-opsin activator domain-containing protein [Haladaptatus caseinilyticus]